MQPSLAARADFLVASALPFLRRIFSASARSPLASCRATLQSIMPALVLSRSSFTSLESIACMVVVVILYFWRRKLPRLRRLTPQETTLARRAAERPPAHGPIGRKPWRGEG